MVLTESDIQFREQKVAAYVADMKGRVERGQFHARGHNIEGKVHPGDNDHLTVALEEAKRQGRTLDDATLAEIARAEVTRIWGWP